MKQWRDKLLMSIMVFSMSLPGFSENAGPIRVLSIDGGGVRGIIPAIVLREMEKELGKPISKIFDLVAGTSTGGIIALALTSPNHLKQPISTAEGLVELYIKETSTIFAASFAHRLTTLGGLFGPKWELTGLATLLEHYLGDTKLSQALIPTLITGYHVPGQTGVEFFSEDAKAHPEDKDCLMRSVGMATSAAPVYFDSVDIDFPWGRLSSVVDGALYKHNPALLAYVNAKKLFPNRKVELYSLGTGLMSAEDLTLELKGRGLSHWLAPIIKHVVIGGSEADHGSLQRLLSEGDEENYFRLNVRIDRAHGEMDNASADNLSYLYNKGIEAVHSEMFSVIIKRLKS